jgi:uncharacterized protein YndB with AHSA1/START domain
MSTIEVRRRVDAPPELVWAQLVDASSWVDWAGFDMVDVEQVTEHGELRRLTSGEALIRELVRVDEPDRRLSLENVSGLPVYHYAGSITLTPNREGTDVEWRAEIEPFYRTAVAVVDVLRSVLETFADALAATAETRRRNRETKGN